MIIKNYGDFINEQKLFIYHTTFKVYDLLDRGLYKNSQIKKWMRMYDFDEYAHCVLVTKSRPTSSEEDRFIGLPKSDLRIRNARFFDSEIKKHAGYMPEDSKKLVENGQEIFLYVFKKNSNEKNRARQLHGFIYEGDVRRYNGLKRYDKTHQWDAEGGMDKTYLTWRAESGKRVELFEKGSYHNLIIEDPVSGIKDVIWSPKEGQQKFDLYPDFFSEIRNWSIKCMKIGTDIEMGDFKRISGLEMIGGKLKIKKTTAENFMLAVGFHDGIDKKNIVEEYIILMPVKVWNTYLPDLVSKKDDFEKMYHELLSHRLKGERTIEQEAAWLQFRSTYKKLSEENTIKLRFKRDSKGQLRIQSAISYNEFKTKVLQNPHIKIY